MAHAPYSDDRFTEYGALPPPLPTILPNMAHAPYSDDKIKFADFGELPPPSLRPYPPGVGSSSNYTLISIL